MNNPDCIFCKIISGEIPSRPIYEDSLFKVILDIEPATKGHALIIPKNHYDDLFDLGKEETEKIFLLAQKLATKMKDTLACDGFNIVQNNGEVANQTVRHFHLHLIPRYENDGNADKICWNHTEITAEDMDEIFKKLR